VGRLVRDASRNGVPGREITGAMLDDAAVEVTGEPLGLAETSLDEALDPRVIIATRQATGGAAREAIESMIARCETETAELGLALRQRRESIDDSRQRLLEQARRAIEQEEEG
jgi:argininosuccinate lyase